VNFLNIGASEAVVIIVIAILAVGPRRMVGMARTLGRTAGKLRRMSGEFMKMVNSELQETGLDAKTLQSTLSGEAQAIEGQVQTTGDQAKDAARSLKQELGSLTAELQAAASEAREFVRREVQAGDDEEAGRGSAPAKPVPPRGVKGTQPVAPATAATAPEAVAPRTLGALGGLEAEPAAAPDKPAVVERAQPAAQAVPGTLEEGTSEEQAGRSADGGPDSAQGEGEEKAAQP
jgi:sec-independent protein translocase protein TatB